MMTSALMLFVAIISSTPQQAAAPDSTNWKLSRTSDEFLRATHKTAVSVSAPYFETVELRRHYGSQLVTCAVFSRPSMSENGVERLWSYTTRTPTSGACVDAGGGEFVAVGRKGANEFRSTRAP